jgi:haloacid dehalogenase-like hydrolase
MLHQCTPPKHHLPFAPRSSHFIGQTNLQTSLRPFVPHRPLAPLRASSTPHIALIVSDVDGTLLLPDQTLSPVIQSAVAAAAAVGVPTIVATGKALGPWTVDILPRLPAMPQIFLQGLLIRDTEGKVMYRRVLEEDVIADALDCAEAAGVQLIAYLGDRIVCGTTDAHTDRLLFYNEPTPEALGTRLLVRCCVVKR